MDMYDFEDTIDLIKGLILTCIVSIMISPVVIFFPSIIIGIIGILFIKKIIHFSKIKNHFDKIDYKIIIFIITIVVIKMIVIFFKIPLKNDLTYQICSFVSSLGASLILQKMRKKELNDVENWGTTILICGLLDAFGNSIPYVISFVTGLK